MIHSKEKFSGFSVWIERNYNPFPLKTLFPFLGFISSYIWWCRRKKILFTLTFCCSSIESYFFLVVKWRHRKKKILMIKTDTEVKEKNEKTRSEEGKRKYVRKNFNEKFFSTKVTHHNSFLLLPSLLAYL